MGCRATQSSVRAFRCRDDRGGGWRRFLSTCCQEHCSRASGNGVIRRFPSPTAGNGACVFASPVRVTQVCGESGSANRCTGALTGPDRPAHLATTGCSGTAISSAIFVAAPMVWRCVVVDARRFGTGVRRLAADLRWKPDRRGVALSLRTGGHASRFALSACHFRFEWRR